MFDLQMFSEFLVWGSLSLIVSVCVWQAVVWRKDREDAEWIYDTNRFTGTQRRVHKEGLIVEYNEKKEK